MTDALHALAEQVRVRCGAVPIDALAPDRLEQHDAPPETARQHALLGARPWSRALYRMLTHSR